MKMMGLKKRWMEILLVMILVGVIYYLFGDRIWEGYTTKKIHSNDEIKKFKNDYLTKKGEYEKADREYKEELNTYTAPTLTSADYTVGDPRIPIPYPTSPLTTIQNRDGNDPYKVCGDKFLNYQKACVADNIPQGASIKSTCTNGVYNGNTLLYNAINGTCLTTAPTFDTDASCPALTYGTANSHTTDITNPAYNSSSKAVPPSQIPGCSAYRLAKKIEMDNAWSNYSPYAKRKKSRRRSWWRR